MELARGINREDFLRTGNDQRDTRYPPTRIPPNEDICLEHNTRNGRYLPQKLHVCRNKNILLKVLS